MKEPSQINPAFGCGITLPQREKIFKGLEYDPLSKFIIEPCNGYKIGIVKMGKIYWLKKK